MTLQERWPLPWSYVWPPKRYPMIVATNGTVVALLSCGNMHAGAYGDQEIEDLGHMIVNRVNEAKT